jgi:hypothetical protein
MKSIVAAAIGACCGVDPKHALGMALVAVLSLGPAVTWVPPARAQDEQTAPTGAAPLVIAQGIGRLPRGELLWTVRRIDVPGGDGAALEELPLGFVLADGGGVALQNEDDEIVALLDDGEAAFLLSGRGGTLVSRGDEPGAVFEIALVSQRQAEAGEIAGNVAGGPFATPDGGAFDLELARAILAAGDEAVIPTARSGAPVLFLLTTGTVQLESGGQVVDLAAGQFALLVGDVLVRGSGDTPAAFVAAAIGEATGERADAAGTPEARAGRGDRQRARGEGGGGGGGGGQQAAAGGARAPREGRAGRGGRGGQGGRQGQPGAGGGTGGAPGAGGVEQPQVPGGTPPAETPVSIPGTPEATATPDIGLPTDGTPTPEATITPEATLTPTPTGDVIEETPADDEPTEEVEEFPTSTPEPAAESPAEPVETPVSEEPPAAAEEPIAEEIAPPAEEPAAEAVEPEAPVEEAPPPVEEPAVVETPAA